MKHLGTRLVQLCLDQSAWSQATFGSDSSRGPVGALKHLSLEALEASECPNDVEEYADCLLLILDASRRAKISLTELITAAEAKLAKCKLREWDKPTDDNPVFHVRPERSLESNLENSPTLSPTIPQTNPAYPTNKAPNIDGRGDEESKRLKALTAQVVTASAGSDNGLSGETGSSDESTERSLDNKSETGGAK